MLSLFPSLLSFEGYSPLLLRLILVLVFIIWIYKELNISVNIKSKLLALCYSFIIIFLFLGIYTQLAALASVIILGIKLYKKIKEKAFLTDGVNYYLILFIISLSLLITGPGFIAFDLPI